MAINDSALDIIFRTARTYRHWQDKPVSPSLLMAIYDLMRWGPTSANTNPGRIVFVVSQEAKERLKPHLDEGNVAKTMSAPTTAILAYDLAFAAKAAELNGRPPVVPDLERDREDAFRNGTLQGAYFIIAARALGLDCGPMGGFDHDGVDREFFAGTTLRSNFLCNVGYGDPAHLRPRGPRLDFDEACKIV